jgi:hypothetical protein
MFTILLPYVFSKVDQGIRRVGSPYNNILVGKHSLILFHMRY